MSESGIFKAAVKLSPEQRAAYLDQACGANAELRREVESLLRAHDDPGSFLRDRPGRLPTTADYEPIAEGPGSVIGPYKLMEQIGEGGFGLVFVADQQHPVRRKVALKIIKPGMDTREVIARFEAERQALALMDHPNIARVFDGGTTTSGRPYFVMELVKGIPINEYCDQQQLTARERLELFLSVCQAVQHAHAKGIIHRDLKPSNILVAPHDGLPVIKVIDFGVAKAIGQQLTNKTIYTRFMQMIGTPLYMSPEQAEINALDVDTRSDIYSLGVLLYELLTGTTPFDRTRFAAAAYDEIRRIIKEEEPPRPSTRLSTMGESLSKVSSQRKTEPAKLSALVRGDLDWIVMKALEKDRARRYDTASAFAADVRHFLAEEPIEARPPSAWYRFRKLARRNKGALATAALVAAALLLGTAASLWQAVRATNAEAAALQDRDDKEEARLAEARQRTIADAALEKAQRERDAANAARQELRRTHYAITMNLIQSAWEAGNVSRVEQLLEELRSRADEDDLRGFEWYYWDRMCHAERRALPLSMSRNLAFHSFSGDGSRIAYRGPDSATAPGPIEVRDTATGRLVQSWPDPVAGGTSMRRHILQLNRDGSRLAQLTQLSRAADGNQLPKAGPGGAKTAKVAAHLVVWDVDRGNVMFEVSEPEGRPGLKLAFAPDGKRIALVHQSLYFGGRDEITRIKIWDLTAPAREPAIIEGGNWPLGVQQLHFNPDGTRLAGIIRTGPRKVGDPESGAILQTWDVASGKPLATQNIMPQVLALAFSPDGKSLAVAWGGLVASPADGRVPVRVWAGADGTELKLAYATYAGATGADAGLLAFPRGNLVFSADGRRLAVAGRQTVVILDAATGAHRQVIRDPAGIGALAFRADGGRLLTIAGRRRSPAEESVLLKEWDVRAAEAGAPAPATRTAHSRDGRRSAVYGRGEAPSEVSLRDQAGTEILVFRKHTRRVQTVAFSPNGRLVFSQSSLGGGEEKIWEADTGTVRWRFPPARDPETRPVPLDALRAVRSHDGRWLALPGADGVQVVQFDDLSERFTLARGATVTFSPDGSRLVAVRPAPRRDADAPPGARDTVPRSGELTLWDVEAGRPITSLPTAPDGVQFSPDSRWFAYGTREADTVTIRAAEDGALRSEFKAPIALATGLVFSPDGARLILTRSAAGGPTGPVPTVWDAAMGKLLYKLDGHIGYLGRIIFSPDGKRIVSAAGAVGASPEIKMWDAVSGRELLSLKPPFASRGGVGVGRARLSFSPDGQRLIFSMGAAGGTTEPREQIWDATPRPHEAKPAAR